MTPSERIDPFLAATLRGESPDWPVEWTSPAEIDRLIERANYHGVVTLLLRQRSDWPDGVREALKAIAIGRASWEVRHREILERVVGVLEQRRVECIFLKGTGLAYHRYEEPADRTRGDTDLLVRPEDLETGRRTLEELGFSPDDLAEDDQSQLQEVWSLEAAGYWHRIDLHWAAFNTRFLDEILPVDECFANSAKLPRLHSGAGRLSGPHFLLHVCIHRNLHRTAPYFSGGKANFGADRLIWAKDIAVLTERFQASDWSEFIALAMAKKIAGAMEEALRFAHDAIGASVPDIVFDRLSTHGASEPRSDYLLRSDRRLRTFANFLAIPGRRARLRHLRNLIAPPDDALRARYPGWPRAPRFILLGRRLLDFALGRNRTG